MIPVSIVLNVVHFQHIHTAFPLSWDLLLIVIDGHPDPDQLSQRIGQTTVNLALDSL
jgi:hypothetical protein